MSPGWIITLILATLAVGSGYLAIRLIGTVGPGRHAGRETFDWQDRPLFTVPRYDQVDRLAARYYMPPAALTDLYRVDRLLADADAILRTVAAR